MEFEWDREKAAENGKRHTASFDEAVTVFHDPLAATFDEPDHSPGERRLITIGHSSAVRLLVVVHTEHGDKQGIISARRAATRERRKHEA